MEYTTAVALTTALVQMAKSGWALDSRYTPVVSLLLGLVVGYLTGMREPVMLLTVGLTASGFYDVAKEPARTVISKFR